MDTVELIKQAKTGDRKAREQVANQNMGLVWSIVKRFAGRGYDTEDLFQIGTIGLIKSIDKFDLDYGVKFSTYAIPMITGEIKRFLRDDGMIKVSRGLKETALRVRLAKERITDVLGREPTIEEISDDLQISVEDIILAQEAVTEVDSLHKTIYHGDGNDISLMDKIESDEDQEEEILNRIALQEVLDSLEDKERQLIELRYYKEKTQTEIGALLGISQVQVSRLEKKILLQMRQGLSD